MSNSQRFCSRPSRLFSGDPSALFAIDSQFLKVSAILEAGLSSPFAFVLDTPQVPNSQFWHIPKISISIFTPSPNNIVNLTGNQTALWLCPPSMVGSSVQDDSGTVGGVNLNNVGIQLFKQQNNLLNNSVGTSGGISEDIYEGPIEVPPLWFLRYTIFDDESGPDVLFPGTIIDMRMMQQVIDVKFASQF
jgi:hypothetical protein